jgi:UPF0755 protein
MRSPKRILKKKRNVYLFYSIFVLVVFASIAVFYLIEMGNFSGLSLWQMYQNVASPYARYVNITEGMRKEEVADRFAKVLGWSEQDELKLLAIHTKAMKGASEGYYFPTTYVVPIRARPEDVSKEIINTFNREVVASNKKVNIINMDTTIKIASIIQREAGKSDMKIVSGIIWNRLFRGMSLDMDATLQYAKGTDKKWWPIVKPEDKNIVSPYNTYKNKGLPPSAISNPGEAAIDAALNPAKTSALFYFHDSFGVIHTAKTYEQQVANIQAYY